MKEKKCEIIAIANQKGGVGKTTTSINLAAALSIAEKKVLVIDMDPQANSTTGFGFDKNEVNDGVYSLLTGEKEIKDVICDYELKYLKIIPANRNLAKFELEMVGVDDNYSCLKNVLKDVTGDFDFIIIDLPPSLGLLTINALSAATSVLIPIQAEYYALEGLSDLIGTINRIQENFNLSLEIKGILLTMYDERTNLSKQVEMDVREYFESKVYKVVVPRNVRLSEAPSFGKPIQQYAIKSAGSKAYMTLAGEIINK